MQFLAEGICMSILFLSIKCYLVPLRLVFFKKKIASSSLSRPSFGDLIYLCGKIAFWPFKNSYAGKGADMETRSLPTAPNVSSSETVALRIKLQSQSRSYKSTDSDINKKSSSPQHKGVL